MELSTRYNTLRARVRELLPGRWVRKCYVINRVTHETWSPFEHGNYPVAVESLRKWLKHNPAEKCDMCAAGAVYLACALDPEATTDDAQNLIRQTEKRMPPGGYTYLQGYNDVATRRESEVIRLFK